MRRATRKDAGRRTLPNNSARKGRSSRNQKSSGQLDQPENGGRGKKMGVNSKPRDKKLASQIVEEFHAAGQRGDVAAFKRLLGRCGAHLSTQVKNQMIVEFKKNANLPPDALKGK